MEAALSSRFTDQPKSMYDDPKKSLVFMHFEFAEGPTRLAYVNVQKGTDLESGALLTDTATHAAMPGTMIGPYFTEPGNYQVSSFEGTSNNTVYNMEDYVKNFTAFTIKEPGIYFLGSYRYTSSGKRTFKLDKIASPNEKELLQKMLTLQWMRGSLWETRIKQRIAQLN